MSHVVRVYGFVVVFLLTAVLRVSAQTATLQGDLLKDWTEMKDTMMKISSAMPEDKFTYKSTPAQRNFGEQVLHVATANVGLLRALGAKAAAPTIDAKATGKAAILKALADSFDYGIAVIKEQTDQTMLQTVQSVPFLGPSTRARLVYFVLGHAWDIYGQMAVYLRLNGVVPPASQRP